MALSEQVETLVIGAGQAGLALSHASTDRGLEHLIVERDRVGGRWASERWDYAEHLAETIATSGR